MSTTLSNDTKIHSANVRVLDQFPFKYDFFPAWNDLN